jgi:hypothetical protein
MVELDHWGVPITPETRTAKQLMDAAAKEMTDLCIESPEPRSRKGRRIFELAQRVIDLAESYYGQSQDYKARLMLDFIRSNYGVRIEAGKRRGWLDGPALEDLS